MYARTNERNFMEDNVGLDSQQKELRDHIFKSGEKCGFVQGVLFCAILAVVALEAGLFRLGH